MNATIQYDFTVTDTENLTKEEVLSRVGELLSISFQSWSNLVELSPMVSARDGNVYDFRVDVVEHVQNS